MNVSTKCLDQVLTCICPCPSCLELKLEIANYATQKNKNPKQRGNKIDYESLSNKLLNTLFTILKKSKNSSIEKRVVCAVLGKTLKKSSLQNWCEEYGSMDITSGGTVSRINEDFETP